MGALERLLRENEDWLMKRILSHAKRCGFTKYTSTLEEAWRLSISGITTSLIDGMQKFEDVPELGPDEDYNNDPLAEFGVTEARRHRERGITLSMFLGLMKYYRQSYIDLLNEKSSIPETLERDLLYITRSFDRIEVAFCQEWADEGRDNRMASLEATNRQMTNEKNRYLTVFESLSDPVIMLDSSGQVVNLNNAASHLVNPNHVPGGHYYHPERRKDGSEPTYGKQDIDSACIGHPISAVFPCLSQTLKELQKNGLEVCECSADLYGDPVQFEVKRSDLLDVSEKLTATIVVLRDITNRKRIESDLRLTIADLERAHKEVKRLTGLLPICASCKKVRDDKGYWQQVEQYIAKRTEATFSHGICPDCLCMLYPSVSQEVLEADDASSTRNPPE